MTRGETRVDRLILWGATLPPEIDLATVNARLRGAKLVIAIGDTDRYIAIDSIDRENARLLEAGLEFELIRYAGGHSIKRSILQQLIAD
jgi:predicted esterase